MAGQTIDAPLPVRVAPGLWAGSGDEPVSKAAAPGGGDEPRAAQALRVLIVEDEFFIALDTQAQVEALGHTVVGMAVSAEQAIRMAAAENPDVVLMDIRLDGPTDGIDAATRIRAAGASDIVFVTANSDPATQQRARAVNPLGFLQKPLTPQRLSHALAGHSRSKAI